MSEPKQPKTRYKTTTGLSTTQHSRPWGADNLAGQRHAVVRVSQWQAMSLADVLGCSHQFCLSTKFLGKRKRKKHGADYTRQWRNVRLGIDANTWEIRAIEALKRDVGWNGCAQ